MVLVEVLIVYAKNLNVVVEQPNDLMHEFKQSLELSCFGGNRLTYTSVELFSKHKQPNQIREALEKGYVEMSHINLSICTECLQVEYEAQHMVERLVSGG